MAEARALRGVDTSIGKALVEELGADCVMFDDDVTSRGAGIWRSDNIEAHILVRPRSTEEVSRAMAVCHAHKQTVIAQGGLTGLVEAPLPKTQML